MAELNPNIILGVKPVELKDPLEQASKALTMKNLMQSNQVGALQLNEAQRQAGDQQSLRDAYKNNTSAGPDGAPVVNRQGIMKDLMDKNPMLAQKTAMDFKAMDLERMTQQHQIAKNILFEITPGDQASLDRAQAAAKAAGLPPLEGVLPATANDPNFATALRNAQMKSLTAEEQLTQANKQQEFAMQKQKNDVETKKLDVEIQHFNYNKRFEANQQVGQALESGRQSPDAQQALKDIYAAQKVNKLIQQGVNEKGELDPNKLNMTQVRLVAGETAKIATGGAPTLDELHGLTPDNMPQWLSQAAEKYNNHPTPANAGEFVKSLQRYSDGVAEDAKTLLNSRESRIIEQRKDDLGPTNYGRYKQGIQTQFTKSEEKAPGGDKTAGGKKIMDFNEWKSQQAKR